MKTLLSACQKFWLVVALLAVGMTVQAQNPTYKLLLTNETNPTPTTYEFDVYLLRTSTTAMEMAGMQFGLGYDNTILNGGTPTVAVIPGFSDFPANFEPTTVNAGVAAPLFAQGGVNYRFFNLAARSLPGAGNGLQISNENNGCSDPGMRVGRFRLTNSVPFAANSTAKHIWNVALGAGRTATQVNAYVSGTNINISLGVQATSNLNYDAPGTCIQNITLNPAATCAITANTTTTPVTCFGGNDGSVTVTITGAGAAAPGTYSLDGSAGVAYNSNPFTVSGLNAGAHTVEILTPCPAAAVPFSIGGPTGPSASTETASACDSYTWSQNTTTYTASGTYTATGTVAGCPHTYTLNLTITPSTSNTTTETACDSYTWSENGATYTTSGTYSNVVGCHTEILALTITASTTNSTPVTACDSYTWEENGQTYTTSGTHTSGTGCHTEELVLTITASTSNSTTESACDSYTWTANSTTYTVSGTYSVVTGCHTETLVLTITPSTSNSTTESACDSYTWTVNSTTYTASGTYSVVTGCHTETLVLTITPSTSNTTTASACESYTWSQNGTTYTASGTYTSVIGCNTETLILTITGPATNTTTETACDSYTWSQNGATYTTSGTYTDVVGCNTEILILTITASTSNSTTASACDSYTWSENSTTYTASGTYSVVTGCHTETLVLTITPTTTNSSNVTACGSYMWSENGMTYTTSGTYSNTVGCHTETIVLTINNVVVTATASGAIQCFGGMVAVNVSATGGTAPYTGTGSIMQSAGTVTYTVTDDAGCTGSATVTLTGPTKVEGTTTTTPANCGSFDGSATVTATGGAGGYTYLWSDGASQTSATATGLGVGTYTVTITDANGCTGTASATVTGAGGQPDPAGQIGGPAGACRMTCVTYTVPPVSGATDYTWTLPAGATGTSTTNSITVCFDNTYSGGFLCVTPSNACGSGTESCINIPVITVRPAQPGFIIGNPNPCGPSVQTYSIPPSANATSYTWGVTGSGVSILSGQGTNTVTVSFPAGFGQSVIGVYAENCVGVTSRRSTTLTGIPTHSSPLTGPGYVCAGSIGVNYSISAAIGAGSSYFWSTSGDITPTAPQGTTSMTFDFGPSFTTGTISVSTASSCGVFLRTYTIRSTPGQPGSIAGPSNNLCGQTGVTYSIAPVATATSYNWTVPAGVTMVSANGGTSMTVDFTPAFTGTGNLCVTAISACGSSIARCYSISALTPPPASPAGLASVCKSASGVVYTLVPVAGATSYLWSISGGASIVPSGTTATVNFSSATSTTAIITVNAVNACGYSQPGKKIIAVNLGCRNASDLNSSVDFSAYPNPTAGLLNVSFQAEKSAKYMVKVIDLLGNVVISDVISATEGANMQELNLSNVAKGMYLLSIETEGMTAQTLRVVVE